MHTYTLIYTIDSSAHTNVSRPTPKITFLAYYRFYLSHFHHIIWNTLQAFICIFDLIKKNLVYI